MRYQSGNTPLIKNKELCKFGFSNVLMKDESKNPFGTFKDRRSELIIKKAINEQADKLVLITSGNSGYSLARFSQGTGIKVVCIIDKNLRELIKREMKKYSSVIEVGLSEKILKPEETITLARQNDEEVIWEVTNGFHEAYKKVIEEIKNENPSVIILPIGSGEAFVGFYSGIKKFGLRTKLIGVKVKDKRHSFADKLHTPWTPYTSKIQSILREGHQILTVEEDEIKKAYKEYSTIFDIEPSSAVVFGVMSKLKCKKDDKIIVINSGKGLI